MNRNKGELGMKGESNMQKYTLDDVVERLDKIIKILDEGNSEEYMKKYTKIVFDETQAQLEKKTKKHLYEVYPSPLDTTDKISRIDPSRGYKTVPNLPNGTYLIPNGYHAEHIVDPSKVTCATTVASSDDSFSLNNNLFGEHLEK